jgi:hypothetical protein
VKRSKSTLYIRITSMQEFITTVLFYPVFFYILCKIKKE